MDGGIHIAVADLVPQAGKLTAQRGGGLFQGVGVVVDLCVDQQRVADGQRQFAGGALLEGTAERGIKAAEVAPLLLVPCGAGIRRVDVGEQIVKTAFAAEPQVVNAGQRVEMQKTRVDAAFLAVIRHGQDARDRAVYTHRAKVAQHADALVPLYHIKAVHKFVCLDRVADAAGQMCVAKGAPFLGKFGLFAHQRQEIVREGRLTAGVIGADDLLQRNLNQPELLLGGNGGVLQDLFQHRQEGGFSARQAGSVGTAAKTAGLAVFFDGHKGMHLLSSTRLL